MKTFTEKVYAVVKKIPKGKVLTYTEVARRAGSPRAARAVGTILSKNYNPAIPCHRVLRSDGGLGGYNRGLPQKKKLLQKEGFDYNKSMKRGFTLLEVLTAVAIVILLTIIIFANINEARKASRDAVRIRDAQLLGKIIDSYYLQYNKLPVPSTSTKNISSLDPVGWETFLKSLGVVDSIPLAPKNGDALEGITPNASYDSNGNPMAPFRKYNYYYITSIVNFGGTSGGVTRPADHPAIYFPLERDPQRVCEEGEDPAEGCTPYCEDEGTSSIIGPADSNNCTNLKRGCVMKSFSALMGGTKAFACVRVGPNEE